MSVSQSLTLTLVSQDVNSNKSTVKVLWTSTQSGQSYNGYTRTANYWMSSNGGAETKYSLSYTLPKNSTVKILEGNITVHHKADGTGSVNVRTWMDTDLYDGVIEKSASLTLPTIPRKSTLTASNGTLSAQQTLTVKQESTNFTHSIRAVCGSSSFYINADGTTSNVETKHKGCSIRWTPPLDWARQAPNNNSVAVTLTITTYNGSTNIGSTPVPITCGIPYIEELNPTVNYTITDANDAVNQIDCGSFVQGQSKVKVDYNVWGNYGADIKSVKTVFEGATYSGLSVTTNTITGKNMLPITITVTDTRDRETIITKEILVLEYKPPRVTKLSAKRCDSDGTPNPSGDHILMSFSAEISDLDTSNLAKYYVDYKKISEPNHTAIELVDLYGNHNVEGFYVIPADTASSYTVIFTAVDYFSTSRVTVDVPTAMQVMSFMKKNGEIVGIAINKVAEHEGYFDIGMPVLFSGAGDIVVEQGQKDGWTYRKWQSGVMECWKILTHSTTITTAWGAFYHGTATTRQTYPFPFIDKPVEQATLTAGSYQAILFPEKGGNGVNGANASACYNVCRPSSITSTTEFYINISVRGRWK